LTETARADGLIVTVGKIRRSAHLIEADRARAVAEIVKDRVVLATGEEVHRVSSLEGQLLVVGPDVLVALRHVDVFERRRDSATHLRIVDSSDSSEENVPGVIANVVRSSRLVDVEKGERAAFVSDLDAHLATLGREWEIGHTLNIDVATDDTDRARKLVVGRDGDILTPRKHVGSSALVVLHTMSRMGSSANSSGEAQNGSDSRQHFDNR
jgi:hypothetical protein